MENQSDMFDPLYLVTLDEIYHSRWAAKKRQRIALLRKAFLYFWPKGHPSRLIHVTGTNGKGSVVHYIEQGLRFSGNIGSWTGPHVFDYAERFHINAQQVSHADIVSIYREMLLPYQERLNRMYPGESLTFAELGILLALHLFDRHGVTWGLMEVGAGGRYTPLMALDMEGCVLTNVGDDHPQTLGTEIWQRALEKAGIARYRVPFFTAAEEPALSYVQKTAIEQGAFPFIIVQPNDIEEMKTLKGDLPVFRLKNLALALKVIRFFYPAYDVNTFNISSDLPARFRRLTTNIIADVAHNPDKVFRLAEQLKHYYPGRKFRFLIGLSRSRNVRRVFAPLLELAEHIVITGASYAGQDPIQLAAELRQDFPHIEAIEEPSRAFEIEKQRIGKDGILVLTGSAYMIDQALNPNPFIRHLNATFGRRVLSSDIY